MVAYDRSSIPTTYEGTRFRSRLEARWAAFFDAIGWRWIYEPFDADGYIPDFLIPGTRPLLVEVKPAVILEDYEQHTGRIDAALTEVWADKSVLIVGVDARSVGILRDEARIWARASWTICFECLRLEARRDGDGPFVSLYRGEDCWPCGHWDGPRKRHIGPTPAQSIERWWREAGNSVQWQAR